MADLLDPLVEWLRIPSISTGGGEPADLRRAAEWAAERVEHAGGSAELVQIGDGNPLAIGDFRANRSEAPTILIYGHYDVQSVGEPSAWTSPPFEPEVRDGRLYARGASDDKGNFWPLMHAACELARAGELPVNVRVVVEGEEEAGSESITEWIRADERGADAAIVFDSGMVDERTPAITVGLRGMAMAQIEVRTGARDLHSGMYGGSVLNALHVLHRMLAAGRARARRDAAGRAARRHRPAGRGRADRVGAPAARRAGALRGRRPRGLPRRGSRVLRAQRRRRLARRQRDRRRRAAHARARRRARHGLPAARARPARHRDRARARAAAARRRAARRRREDELAPRRAVAVRARPARDRARLRRRSSAPPAARPRSSAPAARSRSWPSSRRATSPPS